MVEESSSRALGLVEQLARIYGDEGFRTRVENDELKQPTGEEDEVLLQFNPDELDTAVVLLFQLHRWVNGRARMAHRRQNAKTAAALGMSEADLGHLRSELHLHRGVHLPGMPTDVRPDELTSAFAAVAPDEVLLQGHG